MTEEGILMMRLSNAHGFAHPIVQPSGSDQLVFVDPVSIARYEAKWLK